MTDTRSSRTAAPPHPAPEPWADSPQSPRRHLRPTPSRPLAGTASGAAWLPVAVVQEDTATPPCGGRR